MPSSRIPIKDNLRDEYSNAMRKANEEKCLESYEEKCPFSILNAVMNSGNNIKLL